MTQLALKCVNALNGLSSFLPIQESKEVTREYNVSTP